MVSILFICNSMIICVDPACLVPDNDDSNTYCKYCNSPLLLSDRYLPVQKIGSGGFGRTFLVIDQKSSFQSEQYLIKQFYLNQRNQSNTLISRPNITAVGIPGKINLEEFRRKEISALKKLKHPQVPRYIDDFHQDKYFYIVQEFIEGETLDSELFRCGNFSENQIIDVLKSALNVLQYIHSQNIIHRDIKPENLIRGLGKNIVLVDFGAVKFVADNSHKNTNHTVAATIIGTPNYMPPEQNKGKEIYASDLYSLGVTCIQLLTGKAPNELFDDGNNSWDWKSKSKLKTSRLTTIIDKLIELGTTKRYQSSQDVIDDLKNINELPINVPKKSVNNKNHFNIQRWLNSLGTFGQGIGAIMGILLAFGVFKSFTNKPSQANTNIASIDSLSAVLKSGDWKRADSETYDLLLQISGEEAKSRGFMLPTELKNISCTDLAKIDKVWQENTNGQQGLSAQQLVYETAGYNWKKAYQQMSWGLIKNGELTKTVDRDLDWKNRRFQYMPGKEPNFKNPKPGHLPVTINLVQGIAFPQFTKVCK